jgi:hypothetical protein
MCLVIFIALFGTGYLAVYFTRRAKADLERLLVPLAESIGGEADVEEAQVQGKWNRTIAQGRMASAAAGTVRLWQSDVIDAAAGAGWNYVYSRPNPKKKNPDAEIDIVTESPPIREWLETWTVDDLAPIRPDATDWVQVEYSPGAGYVRVARPMHGRNDIPTPEAFEADLEFAEEVGNRNRAIQEKLATKELE